MTPGGVIVGGGSVRGVVSPPDGATIQQRIDFLLRRVDDLQRQHEDLAAMVAKEPGERAAAMRTLRAELEQRIERRLTETQERYMAARRAGLVCLLLGSALVIASNVLA